MRMTTSKCRLKLDGLVQWSDKWQMQFNVSKCKIFGAFLWTSPLSPRLYWLGDVPVRLHKVYHNFNFNDGHMRSDIVRYSLVLSNWVRCDN